MPLIEHSSYRPPIGFGNAHVLTIFPSLFRKFPDVNANSNHFYRRERIDTPDDDFLDLDWATVGSERLAIISHGLEGDTHRHYMIGMARALNRNGWDALAWNFRACSGETNRQLRMYHNGATDDLETVIQHAFAQDRYRDIALIGFSMGGNLSLVYLGEKSERIDSRIKRAVVFSVPCDLRGCAMELDKWSNKIYLKRFLRHLHQKMTAKMARMPDQINDHNYHLIKNFKDFDDRYTAPLHGFKDAEDYWAKCSSQRFLDRITIPTLIVNAADDPFLSAGSYPVELARAHPCVYLEIPPQGGHVGFVTFNRERLYWSEQRALAFLNGSNPEPVCG